MSVKSLYRRPAVRFASSTLLALLVACGKDSLTPENPTPGIDAISPSEVEQGASEMTITVNGSDFVQNSVVRFNGGDRPTQFVSRSELRATLSATNLASAGVAQVVVANPAPGGGTSNVAQLTVRVRANPAPIITSFSPAHATAGSGATAVTINGTGFVQQSRVFLGNTEKQVSFVSQTQLRITLSETETTAGATLAIRVTNPPPGGGTSAAANFEVRTPTPVINSLGATQTMAGQSSYTLRVNGTGFVANSQVRFNDAPRPTQLVSPGVLQVTLGEGDLRTAGTFAITVSNPAPGGGASNALNFQLVNGTPEITLLPSQGASAGRPGFELMIHGRGFVQGSVVRWNGAERPTQYISGNRLSATISAGDVAAPGSAQITVRNPSPGGGISASTTVTVRAVPSATVTSGRVIALRARDLVWNPQTGRLYLSVPGGAEVNSNSIVAVDPNTGARAGSVFVGSEPGRLARSDNGQYLYVGLNGANAVRRVEMATLTPGLQWSLPSGQVAGDLEVAPGQPNVVAVSRHRPGISPPLDGVTIYDAGVARPNSSPGHTGGARIEFLESASVLYGFNNAHTGFEFFTIAVEPSGARHIAETRGLISGFYTNIEGAAGRIYGTDGSVVDAERRVRVGTLGASGSAIMADPATGRVFMIAEGGIRVYDMNTYQLLGIIPVSGFSFDHPALANTRLVRWGSDGLAFLDQDELFLIRSPIVAP